MPAEASSGGLGYWLRVVAIGRKPKRTLIRLAILVVVSIITFTWVLIPVRVTGISMEPTYHDHGINFINRLAYQRGQPQRGDVVGIRMLTTAGTGLHVMLLKRVVGLPGEAVSFSQGHVCIDGVPLEEPYLKRISDWEMAPVTLGPDDYYVVGDNREMPARDHEHGVAKRSQIVGRVLLTKGG